MRFHLIGIKGMGMAALALIIKKQGHEVQGSDIKKVLATQNKLIENGIRILEFNEVDYEAVDVVIVGHSYLAHEEASLARMIDKEIYEYHEYLNKLMNGHHHSLAIAGSHGKTTTTGLIYSVLNAISPISALVGDGGGYYHLNNEFMIAETCEYQRHFLKYHPEYAVILNIDYDHVDYFLTLDDYIKAFQEFIYNVKSKVFINNDDYILSKLDIPFDKKITFGMETESDYQIKNIINNSKNVIFDFYYKNNLVIKVETILFAPHALKHLLVLFSITHHLGYHMEDVVKNLSTFHGVRRRYEETIFMNDIYIDDYAHHPTQLASIIKFVKSCYKDYEVIAFFQPDRYSRIKEFYQEIVAALSLADQAYVLDFPETSVNDTKEEFTSSLILNPVFPNVKEYHEYYKSFLKKDKKYLFLFMSSKTMDEVIKKVKNSRSLN